MVDRTLCVGGCVRSVAYYLVLPFISSTALRGSGASLLWEPAKHRSLHYSHQKLLHTRTHIYTLSNLKELLELELETSFHLWTKSVCDVAWSERHRSAEEGVSAEQTQPEQWHQIHYVLESQWSTHGGAQLQSGQEDRLWKLWGTEIRWEGCVDYWEGEMVLKLCLCATCWRMAQVIVLNTAHHCLLEQTIRWS